MIFVCDISLLRSRAIASALVADCEIATEAVLVLIIRITGDAGLWPRE